MTGTRSANATALPKKINQGDLESAITDAANFAEVAYVYLAHGLEFQKREAPKLSERESSLVFWVVSQTAEMMRLAEEAFYDHVDGRSS